MVKKNLQPPKKIYMDQREQNDNFVINEKIRL